MPEQINHPKRDFVDHTDQNTAAEKRILFNDTHKNAFGNESRREYRVGLLTYCYTSVGFITKEYSDFFSKEREAAFEAESVIKKQPVRKGNCLFVPVFICGGSDPDVD